MHFFSIITICKENLSELKKTYYSVLNQTYRDFEWIVIDGGSSDGTREWLIEKNIPTWLSEPDSGIYNALNKGIFLSTGKYIIFMNSGDCFVGDNILTDCQSIIEQKHFPAFVYGDSIDISENGASYYRKAKNYKENWKGMITQHQAMLFNKEKLENLLYADDYKLSGDYAFISSVLKGLNEIEILYLNFSVCKFSMGGLNESKRFDALKEDFKIRKEIIRIPLITNTILYFLHYIHGIIKKSNPALRFLNHKSIN